MHPDERDALVANAARLGVETPIVSGLLRQNWGRCVFWDQGCRLHAELGVEAKPRTCRQFPVLAASNAMAIDPACFHADPDPSGDATVFFTGGAVSESEVDLDWDDLAIGKRVAARLRDLPLVAVTDGPMLGPLTRQVLEGLDRAVPRAPSDEDRALLDGRARTVLRFGLAPAAGLAELLVGGGQLVVGAGIPVGTGFAAWARLLRTGVV